MIGGGQDARDVTTTSTKDGKFEARFFHLLMEEEFGRIKGHFGPINTLAFHPDGRTGFKIYIRLLKDNVYKAGKPSSLLKRQKIGEKRDNNP